MSYRRNIYVWKGREATYSFRLLKHTVFVYPAHDNATSLVIKIGHKPGKFIGFVMYGWTVIKSIPDRFYITLKLHSRQKCRLPDFIWDIILQNLFLAMLWNSYYPLLILFLLVLFHSRIFIPVFLLCFLITEFRGLRMLLVNGVNIIT